MKWILAGVASLIVTTFFAFMNYAEPTGAAIAWNRVTGETFLQKSGWHFTPPWVFVSFIDARPMRVCVPSSGRNVGCKLVKFEAQYYKDFIETEGFRYWWWANRFSINMGYDDEYRGMKDLLRGYAFSGTPYQFISVLNEYGGQK